MSILSLSAAERASAPQPNALAVPADGAAGEKRTS